MVHLVGRRALTFLGGIKWYLAAGAAALALIGGGLYAADQYVEGERDEARSAAISECNSVQLEEDLRAAEKRATRAEARLSDLSNELQTQRQESAELQAFVDSLQGDLSQFDDGELSERSRQFVSILSERARSYDQDSDN